MARRIVYSVPQIITGPLAWLAGYMNTKRGREGQENVMQYQADQRQAEQIMSGVGQAVTIPLQSMYDQKLYDRNLADRQGMMAAQQANALTRMAVQNSYGQFDMNPGELHNFGGGLESQLSPDEYSKYADMVKVSRDDPSYNSQIGGAYIREQKRNEATKYFQSQDTVRDTGFTPTQLRAHGQQIVGGLPDEAITRLEDVTGFNQSEEHFPAAVATWSINNQRTQSQQARAQAGAQAQQQNSEGLWQQALQGDLSSFPKDVQPQVRATVKAYRDADRPPYSESLTQADRTQLQRRNKSDFARLVQSNNIKLKPKQQPATNMKGLRTGQKPQPYLMYQFENSPDTFMIDGSGKPHHFKPTQSLSATGASLGQPLRGQPGGGIGPPLPEDMISRGRLEPMYLESGERIPNTFRNPVSDEVWWVDPKTGEPEIKRKAVEPTKAVPKPLTPQEEVKLREQFKADILETSGVDVPATGSTPPHKKLPEDWEAKVHARMELYKNDHGYKELSDEEVLDNLRVLYGADASEYPHHRRLQAKRAMNRLPWSRPESGMARELFVPPVPAPPGTPPLPSPRGRAMTPGGVPPGMPGPPGPQGQRPPGRQPAPIMPIPPEGQRPVVGMRYGPVTRYDPELGRTVTFSMQWDGEKFVNPQPMPPATQPAR